MFSYKIIQQEEVTICQLSNGWMTVETSNIGARLYRIFMPDREGNCENILINYDDPKYFKNDPYCFGATAGPVAGRIKNAQWKGYSLEKDDYGNALHCGMKGWQNQSFILYEVREKDHSIEVEYRLHDHGITGLPEAKMHIIYRLTDENTLNMIYRANAEEETLWNPTNHAYFNLSGKVKSIRDHQLMVNSSYLLKTGRDNVPTGELQLVDNTEYDFKVLTYIKDRIPNGLDDCYILANDSQRQEALMLQHQESGRKINIYTDRESVVLFTGTGMTDCHILVNGSPLISEEGLAIEFQEVPDAIHNQMSDITLQPNIKKEKMTTYQFLVN